MAKTESRAAADRRGGGEKTVETHLSGMKAIAQYIQRSEPTVIKLVRDFGFPARKIAGIWESDKQEISDWRIKLLNGGN